MKRRTADCGKIRRIKRNKITDQLGSNTLLYIKFLLLWAVVITADFLLEFRFEFLWPFWLLLRSVHDSFKYKGLAFSVLFVCIAITSDLICLFFIPVQWLFFAASTYVWVQYVWHTDKGICLPTIILWILFVYLEAAIRWKDNRNIPHMDLCRPFAAHCIGYPVVTLGFGFKSYVGYRIRQRKQREVAKANEFYMQLLQDALPKEETSQSTESNETDSQPQLTEQKDLQVMVNEPSYRLKKIPNEEKKLSSSSAPGSVSTVQNNSNAIKNAQSKNSSNSHANGHAGNSISNSSQNSTKNVQKKTSENSNSLNSNSTSTKNTANYTCQQQNSTKSTSSQDSLNKSKEIEKEVAVQLVPTTPIVLNDSVTKQNGHIVHNNDAEIQQQTCDHSSEGSTVEKAPSRPGKKNRAKQALHNPEDNQNEHQHCECYAKLEAEAKKLKSEVGSLKNTENELRRKMESNAIAKSCLLVKQKENDETQQKLLKKIREERRHRQSTEAQLNNERKLRKVAEEKASRSECTENCKIKRQQLEMEINKLRRDVIQIEDAKHNAEKHSRNIEQEMRKIEMEFRNRESQEVLMSALAAMQDKNATLEKNLSAETRVKLDLFSALGEAKRQIEINNCSLRNKDLEIMDLKAKIVQLLAVMPQIPSELSSNKDSVPSSTSSSLMSQLLLQSNSSSSMGNGVSSPQSPLSHLDYHSAGQLVQMNSACPSNLDPNATVYTPKNSIIEA